MLDDVPPAFFADAPLPDLLPPDERLDVDREPDELFALLLDEPDDELLLLDALPPLLFVEADLPEPERAELERPELDPPDFERLALDFAEPEPPELELPFVLLRDADDDDLEPLDDDRLPPLLDFDRAEPPLELEPDLRPPVELAFPDPLLPDDTAARLPEPDVIVSAAAPTAPTAAPEAAPLNISPATSTTLSMIDEPLELRERDEVELFRELPDLDLLAMYVLPKMIVIKSTACDFNLA